MTEKHINRLTWEVESLKYYFRYWWMFKDGKKRHFRWKGLTYRDEKMWMQRNLYLLFFFLNGKLDPLHQREECLQFAFSTFDCKLTFLTSHFTWWPVCTNCEWKGTLISFFMGKWTFQVNVRESFSLHFPTFYGKHVIQCGTWSLKAF